MQHPSFQTLSLGQQVPPTPAASSTLTDAWLHYGADNLYPQQLIQYRSYSATHRAILQLKADLVAGEGILPDTALAQQWLPLHMLQALGMDYALFNGFALQIIWSRDGRSIAQWKHLPFGQMRAELPGVDGQVRAWYYSTDWAAWQNQRLPAAKPERIPTFDPELSLLSPRQVMVFTEYAPELPVYPLPSYHSALADILFEREYAQFRLATMSRGMFPSMHMHVENVMSTEEKEAMYTAIKNHFAGANKAGELLLTFGEPGMGSTTVTPLNFTAQADTFVEWANQSTQRIISAHRLSSPVLAGLPGRSGLGGNGAEITTAFEHFFNTVISGMQYQVLSQISKLQSYTPLAGQALSIANSKPIRYVFSENILKEVLTRGELRAELGYNIT